MTDSTYQRRILAALNTTGKHVFGGIEAPAERTERRREDRARRARALTGRRRRRALAAIEKNRTRKECAA